MRLFNFSKILFFISSLIIANGQTLAEDIDLFVGNTSSSTAPNILIVLDNTSNWARQSQQWPGGEQQGQSEVMAIKQALSAYSAGKINIGLMEFVSDGNANDNGGYVRHAIKSWDGSTNTSAFNGKLDTIYAGINSTIEKRNSNTEYGNLVYDVYNYLAGNNVYNSGGGTPISLADGAGYQVLPTRFKSPLTDESICNNTYIIYITNPNSSGPATDSSNNSTVLANLIAAAGGTKDKLAGDSAGLPIPLPIFTTTTATESTLLKTTTSCYSKNESCSNVISSESVDCTIYGSCTCTELTSNSCNNNQRLFKIFGNNSVFTVSETNTYNNTVGTSWNFDDWAKFLYLYGVPYGTGDNAIRVKAVTYTIDVFNKQQNAEHTSLMMSAAKVGGGRYFAAKNKQAITVALQEIISEILSVNSSFASAALPVTATNRSQNENQVYVPMFRPDPQARPRWFGNLKRYEIGYSDGYLALVDKNKNAAANGQTGFINDCAISYWTTGTGFTDNSGSVLNNYWQNRAVSPDPRSECSSATYPYSDSPDGPFVEKGGVSEILRKGNTATDGLVHRSIFTQVDSTGLVTFNSTNSSLSDSLVNYIRGQDIDNADGNKIADSEARITIHGDVVHSKPLPINYGGSTGVTVFYGSNDGMYHAVNAQTGVERWSFVAKEHYGKLARIKDNSPSIKYPNQTTDVASSNTPKDYFFDGSTASLTYYNSSGAITKAWIYPTMRRGGRMLYALNVTDPTSPQFMWKKGCASSDDTTCDTGFTGIGQTWSVPALGLVKGYESGNKPVLIMGGGYDSCEDDDLATTTCTSAEKGRAVYVLDAQYGTLLATFQTEGAVPSDAALADVDSDGRVDFAYVADTRGNVYRIDFVNPSTHAARASADWTIKKIASTTGANRKFLYGPDVFNVGSAIYLALGSGNRERPLMNNYPYASDVQDRFYMLMDQPSQDIAAYSLDSTTYMNQASASSSSSAASCTTEKIVPGTTKRGWWYDYAYRGEQTVTSALIHLGTVTFSTSQAGSSTTTGNMCAKPLGVARSYTLNLFNGSGAVNSSNNCGGDAFVEMAGGGIPPSPVLATVVITLPDGSSKKETVIIGAGSKGIGDVKDAKPKVSPKVKRKYWGSNID